MRRLARASTYIVRGWGYHEVILAVYSGLDIIHSRRYKVIVAMGLFGLVARSLAAISCNIADWKAYAGAKLFTK